MKLWTIWAMIHSLSALQPYRPAHKSLVPVCLFGMMCLAPMFCVAAICGDDRDKVINEYIESSSVFVPECSNFSRTAHSQHFSFKELNTGDFAWAILQDDLLIGIETTRTNYDGGGLTINSGYRNPFHNAKITGSATDSRHLHGDAVDFRSEQANWDSIREAGKKAAACSEPQMLSGWGHVHLDWRGDCPPNW
jgi:hypothetical protein